VWCALACGRLLTLLSTVPPQDKSNALHLAARRGGESIFAYCSQKLDVNLPNNYGFTPLHIAAESGNNVAVQWLLKHQADVHARTANNETAMQMADANGHEVIRRALQTAAALDLQKKAQMELSATRTADPPVPPPSDALAQTPFRPSPSTLPLPQTAPTYSITTPQPTAEEFEELQQKHEIEVQELRDKIESLEAALKEKSRLLLAVKAAMNGSPTNGNHANANGQQQRACNEQTCRIA